MSEIIRNRYNEWVSAAACDDFWGQVRRTVNGQPIGEEQVEMIVEAIVCGLNLHVEDTLLDLCCGNGVLTDRIFAQCAGGQGVDFTEKLIAVAQQHFARPPNRRYVLGDVLAFATTTSGSFTKAMCYGSFGHFSDEEALALLSSVRKNYPLVQRFLLGNLADKTRLHDFYYRDAYVPGIENQPDSPLGMWRTPRELARLAKSTGWTAQFAQMPASFHAAHYRFDAILSPLR